MFFGEVDITPPSVAKLLPDAYCNGMLTFRIGIRCLVAVLHGVSSGLTVTSAAFANILRSFGSRNKFGRYTLLAKNGVNRGFVGMVVLGELG